MTGPPPDLERPALRLLEHREVFSDGEPGLALVDPLGLTEPTFVPAGLLPLLSLFDGERTAAGICREAAAGFGQRVPEALVLDLVRQLDDRLLLHSGRFRAAAAAACREFVAAGTRPCRHAGSAGYPRAKDRVAAALAELVPEPDVRGTRLRGLVAPHIDLARGRAGYAAAYGALLAAEPAELYVVLGTGHRGPMAAVTGLPLDWQTPLGVAATDRDFVAAVHDRIGAPAAPDLLLHRDEHSLEFQVLFLQHLAERRGRRPFQVACFLCGSLPSAGGDPTAEAWLQELLLAFREAEAASGKLVCYVAGADLAHVGPFFGDKEPVDETLLARLRRDELARLAHLQAGEPGPFHASVVRDGNPDRVCSATALTLTALLAGGRGELLHYGQAAAPAGEQVVGFCSMTFPAR